MNIKLVLKLVGSVLLVEGLLLILPLLVALGFDGDDANAITLSMVLVLIAGGVLQHLKPRDDTLHAREGFAVVAIGWFLVSFFGALPFWISGYIPSLLDAIFETVSGFTTTGATILTNAEALPKGLLFWRSLTHWAGGMGVLVLSLAILPKVGGRSIHLMRAESSGPAVDKLVPRVGNTAKILYSLYIAMSAIMLVALLLCGLNWYDALIHMFGAAGTGGFSNYNLSVAQLNNPAAEIVIAVFMALFGVNFAMYYHLLHRNWKALRGASEWKVYLAVLLAATAIIALNILPIYGWNVGHALRASFFQASSVMTTTGYATENFDLWPQLSRMVLLFLMVVGGCAGSTAGGLKVIRVQLLLKNMLRDVRKTVHPKSVNVIKLDGRPVDEKIVSGVTGYFFASVLILMLSTLIVSLDNFDFETSFTAVMATFFNIGPGLGEVGPLGNFSIFSPLSKIVLTLCMLLGRLEIFPILMLFSSHTWKR